MVFFLKKFLKDYNTQLLNLPANGQNLGSRTPAAARVSDVQQMQLWALYKHLRL